MDRLRRDASTRADLLAELDLVNAELSVLETGLPDPDNGYELDDTAFWDRMAGLKAQRELVLEQLAELSDRTRAAWSEYAGSGRPLWPGASSAPRPRPDPMRIPSPPPRLLMPPPPPRPARPLKPRGPPYPDDPPFLAGVPGWYCSVYDARDVQSKRRSAN